MDKDHIMSKKIRTSVELANLDDKEVVNINFLNDDSLIYIFEFLSISDKLKIEFVCKRWNCLSKKSWNSIKNLELNKDLLEKHLENFANKKDNTNFIVNVLNRCGFYLCKLSLYCQYFNSNYIIYDKLIEKISKYCRNLTDFRLTDGSLADYEPNALAVNSKLPYLFYKNKKLRNIFLSDLSLSGHIFSELNPENIEELSLDSCNVFVYDEAFYNFLTNLKKLKKFSMNASDTGKLDSFIKTIQALSSSSCEDITEICISSCDRTVSKNLNTTFFSKQKKLEKFAFKDVIFDVAFLNCLSKDYLVTLEIHYTEEQSHYLHRFQNLKYFECFVDTLTDQCVKGITKCKNLKEIIINSVSEYSLTSIGEQYFSLLQNAEKISINFLKNVNFDNLLIALAHCNKLIDLCIMFCDKATGFDNISLLPKLESLDVSFTSITEEALINFIRKSLSIKKLEVSSCKNLTNNLVEIASQIKSERNDSHVLEISCSFTQIDRQLLENLSPLIKLT